jgi:hypothetical protein
MLVWPVRSGAAGARDDPERNGRADTQPTNVTVQAGAATGKHLPAACFLGRCSRAFRQGKGSLTIALGMSAQLAHRQPARKSA